MSRALVLAVAVALAACATGGDNAAVRGDIVARVQNAQSPIAACYQNSLNQRHKLRGMMVLKLAAAPTTGQFVDITVQHDEINDPVMKKCVIDALGARRLDKPQSGRVEIPSLPIRFDWTNP